jgi:cytochrome c5
MNKEQAEREAAQVNSFLRKPYQPVCEECRGTGRAYAPLHGDPNLGYCDAGPCPYCVKGKR